MRPPAESQSTLRSPLNHVLGTEARVRILRVLTADESPVSAGEIARRAALRPSGVRVVVAELVGAGVVEMVGSGPRRLVRFRHAHPLANAIVALFAAERSRVDRLFDRVQRAAVRALPQAPRAVWLQGPLVTGDDRPDDVLTVGVLNAAIHLDTAVATLRVEFELIARTDDIKIDVVPYTTDDLASATPTNRTALAAARPVIGPPPLSFLKRQRERRGTRRG